MTEPATDPGQDILLVTLNARYIHSSLGLRYLKANMGELETRTAIREFIIDSRPIDIVEQILALQPVIVGFGVYIWNIEETTRVVAMLKELAPQITVVLGGPEVSFEHEQQAIVSHADYVICGAADKRFGELCDELLRGDAPTEKILRPPPVKLDDIRMPYHLYDDDDVANRVIYVEASRGCPFKCEFCLSALDKTAWPFDLDRFLAEMEILHQRGVRHFKFVDRTFNLKVETGVRIMEFFLARLDDELFLHFEVIPDHLPDRLKEMIQKFPPNSLQFEVGIQTLNPGVQRLISRKQDNAKSKANLAWINEQSHAHIHTDLIIGLPGEDMASFARGFDELCAVGSQEIQVGILKRLRGSPIIRHTDAFGMRYNPYPPYNILANNLIDFATLQRLNRFARYWDMIANSGRFQHSRALILGDHPFDRFMQLSDWLFATTSQTHKIALKRLIELVYQALVETLAIDRDTACEALWLDFQAAGLKGRPGFADDANTPQPVVKQQKNGKGNTRQTRHG